MDEFAPLEKNEDGRYRIQQETAMDAKPLRLAPNIRSGIGYGGHPGLIIDAMSSTAGVGLQVPLSKQLMQQRSDALRGKLISVGERFVGFDKVVEEETFRRRMIEEQRMAELVDTVQKLERAVNNEIRRRVESNKTLQTMTERFANEMLDDLQRKMLSRMEKLTCAIESLNIRCQTLEKGIQQFKGELPSKLQMDTASLIKAISELAGQMEANKKGRLERDQDFAKRSGEVEFKIDQKADNAFISFDKDLAQFAHAIECLGHTDEADEEEFRAFILEELQTLKNGLSLAAQARERTDDEIVVAINQYTTALQKGLRKAI
eukprot:GEMP01043477.1.p1 GENE.GEMP01043477.1~~GEMP01043477.1.p1  ORF type:complete len:319 (+),score=95.01 GEMP01043477.1:232-1188(+)